MPERLVLEQRAMVERFPQFTLFRHDNNLYWLGKLTTNRGNVYELVIKYPETFPDHPPQAYPIDLPIAVFKSPASGALKHQYTDGHLCLYYPSDRSLGKQATAATVVALASAWLFAYEYWLSSDKQEWPGIEAD